VHKPIFITGAVITGVFYVASLVADRMLRHRHRLPGFLRRKESIFSMISIVFGSIAALALILLSILDADYHSTAHWVFTVIFIVGVALNAVFFVAEINSLSHDHYHIHDLKKSRDIKLGLVSAGIVFAIIMVILMAICDNKCKITNINPKTQRCPDTCDGTDSTAAVFEWIIAFIFAFYVATFAMDLEVAHAGIRHEAALEAGNRSPKPQISREFPPVGGSAQ